MAARRAGASGTVSINTVGARAGVSIATVSRVMNGITNRATAETVRRVREAAEQLGYRPISVGRALRERRSRLVAVLAPNLANPSMAAIAAAIEDELRAQGLILILCDTHDRAEIQDEYLREMQAQLVRATVLVGAVDSPYLNELARADVPLLFVNRRAPDARGQCFIGIDNHQAGADVAHFLLAEAVDVAMALHPDPGTSATRARVAGFTEALAAAGRPACPPIAVAGIDHLAIGRAGIARVLEAMPRGRIGLFCVSDLIAYGAHAGLRGADPAIATRVVTVGFDDNPLNDWLAPWLTSVRVPYEQFGPAVGAALGRIWSGERGFEAVLGHHLVVRRG